MAKIQRDDLFVEQEVIVQVEVRLAPNTWKWCALPTHQQPAPPGGLPLWGQNTPIWWPSLSPIPFNPFPKSVDSPMPSAYPLLSVDGSATYPLTIHLHHRPPHISRIYAMSQSHSR